MDLDTHKFLYNMMGVEAHPSPESAVKYILDFIFICYI